MRKGGRIFINTFAFYDLRHGKFARSRSAEFRKIARPGISVRTKCQLAVAGISARSV
jgi:hypothetical protein